MTEDEQREIERDFAESWDYVEEDYATITSSEPEAYMKPMLGLIAELRARGYDRQLRAGLMMLRFFLSRARHHDLRDGQAAISIEPLLQGGMKVRYWEFSVLTVLFKAEKVEITPELDELLKRLAAQPID